jgi:TonB family protein
MYFDLEDNRPDTPTIPRTISLREGVELSIIFHLLMVIAILVVPKMPFMQELEWQRQAAIAEERRLELERQRENARFVFVQPRIDTPAPAPPPRAELSDLDRQARTVERAKDPTNPLPFSRGNSPERIETAPPVDARGDNSPDPDPAPSPDPSRRGLTLPDAPAAIDRRSPENGRHAAGPSTGVLSEAIRNVQRYAEKEGFANLQGGANQDFSSSIQFDTKGVDFGPWLRRFVAQIRRNWFIPYAAMTLHGHVAVTFNVHRDGRISDLAVMKPSDVDAFNNSAHNAIAASNPTLPLPGEYPDDRAFFTVTFYFNENPPQ